MDASQLTWIANFIWGIADDVLRDPCVRAKRLRATSPPVGARYPRSATGTEVG